MLTGCSSEGISNAIANVIGSKNEDLSNGGWKIAFASGCGKDVADANSVGRSAVSVSAYEFAVTALCAGSVSLRGVVLIVCGAVGKRCPMAGRGAVSVIVSATGEGKGERRCVDR